MTIRWLERAAIDLEDAHDYIAIDNPTAASRTIEIVLDSIESLKDNPWIGRAGRVQGTRELVINGTPYIAAYRVKNDALEILRVLHSARKWPKRF